MISNALFLLYPKRSAAKIIIADLETPGINAIAQLEEGKNFGSLKNNNQLYNFFLFNR